MRRPPLLRCGVSLAACLCLGCIHPASAIRVVSDDFARNDSNTDGEGIGPEEDATARAPAPVAAIRQLRVLTFNLWTLELPLPSFVIEVSRDIDSRLKLLPGKVAETGADILVFQEIWKEERKLDLIERFRKLGFPYSIHNTPDVGALERGLLGNGLLIISRFPLSSAHALLGFTRYTRGVEYFARKGAIKTSVSVPGLGWVDLVDAHLGSIGTEMVEGRADHFNERDRARLRSQAEELVRFIAKTSSSGIVLAAMDMNTHYQQFAHGAYQPSFAPEYAVMTCAGHPAPVPAGRDCLGLTDTFRRIHGFEAQPEWTYDTRSNRYAGSGEFAREPPGVLDYIFVSDNPRLVPVSSEVVFREHPTEADGRTVGIGAGARLPAHLSDHYGVVTTFEIRN